MIPFECFGCGGYDVQQPQLRWAVRLQPYIKNLQVFECPSGSMCTLEQWGPCGWGWHFPPEWKGIKFGYGYNLRLAGWHIKGPNGEDTGTGRPLAQVPKPAEVIAIADSDHLHACCNRVTFANTCNVNCKPELNDPNNWPNYTRHTDGSIVIFADGHVKWLDVHYLYQNSWVLHGGDQF